ncbi:MAG: class I SAM-dependent methyltransferase [Leptolyngbyaceae cyanobacterium]
MNESISHWDKIRPQFDALPYPNQPLAKSPSQDFSDLAKHNCAIPFYLRNHQVIDSQDKWILDAGCGSGFKLLALAIANPGANLVGVDISPKSLEMAQQRLEYHQIPNKVHFHCLPIETLSNLPYTFDYINCDDVLYLLEDPAAGLAAMRSALNLDGIIRANMHSALQRADYYRMQKFWAQVGCFKGASTTEEMAVVRQTMAVLEDWVLAKKQTWTSAFETDDERLLANYLLRGDTGSTMADFSVLLRQAGLEFINMVNWQQWNLEELFKNIEDLPIAVALNIASMTLEEQLYLFELLNPIHRLLDLYCGHPGQGRDRPPVEDWPDELWPDTKAYLHPQLKTTAFRTGLEASAENLGLLPLDQYLKIDGQPIGVDSSFSSCLHALLSGPKSVTTLVERWQQVRPVNLITLEPTARESAFQTVRNFLIGLERAGYLMLETPSLSDA